MQCRYYKCQQRATKYMLNKVKRLGLGICNERAHPYCDSHWRKVHRRYWS